MKLSICSIMLAVLLLAGCSPKEIEFIEKEFIIQGTTQKISVKIPKTCDDFDTGLKINIDAMVQYAGNKAEFEANYQKINLISEFSERLRAITTAQCKIMQTSLVIDTKNSDVNFYNDLVRNYVEYQKVRDIINSSPSESQKERISGAILSVYEAMYKNKKDELLNYINSLNLKLEVSPGTQVSIYRNDQLLVTFITPPDEPIFKYTVDKKYLLPGPDEIIKIKFRIARVGFTVSEKVFTVTQLEQLSKGAIDIRLD